jgi:hypothetical protein
MFSFETGWVNVKFTPKTVPSKWISVNEVFNHFLKRLGLPHHAAGDLHRQLAAGNFEPSMTLRNIGTKDKPVWRTRELGVEFWRRLSALGATQDKNGQWCLTFPTAGLDEKDIAALSGWIWYVCRERVESITPDAPQRGRRSSRGKKAAFDWEAALIEAAAFIYDEDPQSFTPVLEHIGLWFGPRGPGDSEIKRHITPLYKRLKGDKSNS